MSTLVARPIPALSPTPVDADDACTVVSEASYEWVEVESEDEFEAHELMAGQRTAVDEELVVYEEELDDEDVEVEEDVVYHEEAGAGSACVSTAGDDDSEDLECPVCLQCLVQPCRVPCCGKVFCKRCLLLSFVRSTTAATRCPLCRAHIGCDTLDRTDAALEARLGRRSTHSTRRVDMDTVAHVLLRMFVEAGESDGDSDVFSEWSDAEALSDVASVTSVGTFANLLTQYPNAMPESMIDWLLTRATDPPVSARSSHSGASDTASDASQCFFRVRAGDFLRIPG